MPAEARITASTSPVSAVGQGAIGIEIREDDEFMRHACEQIGHPETMECVTAERVVMRRLEGGCQVPIGAYAPSSSMRPVHLDPEEAVRAALDVGATRVVGMHFGTFELTDEPMQEPQWRFHSAAYRAGLDADRAWTLNIGETRRW